LVQRLSVLKEYLIGAGGWAYFQVSGLDPLVAYSRMFNFVEVNSTFYSKPELKMVERWRRVVPFDFKFSVRAHKSITHKYRLRAVHEVFDAFELMKQICRILGAEVLHLQTPASFEASKVDGENFEQLLSSLDLGGLRLALELRGAHNQGLPSEFSKVMQDHDLIHCVDLSKGEMPGYHSDILYTRLFGRGHHNVYQPSDVELMEIDRRVSDSKSGKVAMSFHFVKMYKDAARLKVYKQTGKFPTVTRSTGIASLEEVLSEDVAFPATKQDLITKQGWKLFDRTDTERARVGDYLQKVPEGRYENIGELVESLTPTMK
jgi:uncharacterized protein YecE (DUF72 family)